MVNDVENPFKASQGEAVDEQIMVNSDNEMVGSIDFFTTEAAPQDNQGQIPEQAIGHEQTFGEVAEEYFGANPNNVQVDLDRALVSLAGLEEFRPGQKETIARILRGESTLLVMPTGAISNPIPFN